MEKKIQKISKIISEEGIFSFFLKVLRYIRKNICGITKAIIFELDLEHPVPKIATKLELSFRMATKKDIDSMDDERYGYDQSAKQYSRDRLAKGDSCVLALFNGKIIGYVWIMKDHIDISKFNYISLSKKRVSTYNAFVLKEFRGKRVRNAMNVYLIDIIRKSGKRFVVCVVDKDNKASIKCVERAGFKRIGCVNQFRFFGLKHDYMKKRDLSHLQNL